MTVVTPVRCDSSDSVRCERDHRTVTNRALTCEGFLTSCGCCLVLTSLCRQYTDNNSDTPPAKCECARTYIRTYVEVSTGQLIHIRTYVHLKASMSRLTLTGLVCLLTAFFPSPFTGSLLTQLFFIYLFLMNCSTELRTRYRHNIMAQPKDTGDFCTMYFHDNNHAMIMGLTNHPLVVCILKEEWLHK